MSEHRYLVSRIAVIAAAKCLLIRAQNIRIRAPPLRQRLGVLQQHAPGENDPGLLLGIPLVGISKVDSGVFHHLRLNFPLDWLSILHIRVKAEIHTPISIHRAVPHKLPDPGGKSCGFKQGGKLTIEHPGDLLQPPGRELGCRQQWRSLKGHVVRCNGGHLKEYHPLQEVEHWGRQPLD